jgi:hypothetical protein
MRSRCRHGGRDWWSCCRPEGESTDWSGKPHNEAFCSVEIVEHPQRVLMIELSWVAHRTREVADCESNVYPKLRRWVKHLADQRLITL